MRQLDRRIDIERFSAQQSPSGFQTQSWQAIVQRREAAVIPVRGDERFVAEQFVAKQQVEFRIRWSADVAEVSPLDRIIYPAANGTSPAPGETDIYDIMEVTEIGRREGLRIMAARRAEGGNA